MKVKNVLAFFNFNTDSINSLCARANYLSYVKGKHQGHRRAFLDFLNFALVRKNDDFAEFNIHSFIGSRSLSFITHDGGELVAVSYYHHHVVKCSYM